MRFPLYKPGDLGYNSCTMPATRARSTAGPIDVRRGRRGHRGLLLVLSFFVGFLVFDGLAGERGTLALIRTREQYAALEAQVQAARAENQRLREDIRRLNDDPAAIEEIARRELGLIKPGERLFIIHDVAPQAK
jgi:cell division protein FtsB